MDHETYRKVGADRRTALERRNPSPASYNGIERRTDSDRRVATDRRSGALSSNKSKSFRNKILNLFSRMRRNYTDNRKGKPPWKQDRINSVYLDGLIPRAHERTPCSVPVHVYDRDANKLVAATAYNFSPCGMYLESEYAPKTGTGITVRMDDYTVGAAKPADIPTYHSRVVWRNKVSGNVVFVRYGIGIKHCLNVDEFLRLFGL